MTFHRLSGKTARRVCQHDSALGGAGLIEKAKRTLGGRRRFQVDDGSAVKFSE